MERELWRKGEQNRLLKEQLEAANKKPEEKEPTNLFEEPETRLSEVKQEVTTEQQKKFRTF